MLVMWAGQSWGLCLQRQTGEWQARLPTADSATACIWPCPLISINYLKDYDIIDLIN
uniref:Uncharacterized protein n=1 Tax=Amphimedon queenslandica TaxID=400682 RepID=A0A1X7TF12_AMPQE